MQGVLAPLLFTIPQILYGQKFVKFDWDDEPMSGFCDSSHVHVLKAGIEGQGVHRCSLSKEEIATLLTKEAVRMDLDISVRLKKHEPLYTLVNCKGQLIAVELYTRNDGFNELVRETFTKMGATWSAGTYQGNPVDSGCIWTIGVKDGRIILE